MNNLSKLETLVLKLKRNRSRLHIYRNINISKIPPYLYFIIFTILCINFIYYIYKYSKDINDVKYLRFIMNLVGYYVLIEYLFFEKDFTYFKSIILWHSSLKFYFVKDVDSLFRLIRIHNKQYINKLIITNIEVIGIVLSELAIVVNRTSSIHSNLNIVNALIISVVLVITLVTFIKDIKAQFLKDIINLQSKGKLQESLPRTLRVEKSQEDKKIKEIKQELINYEITLIFLKHLYWKDVRIKLGKDFDYITDNMF